MTLLSRFLCTVSLRFPQRVPLRRLPSLVRAMAFTAEERGSPYSLDYRIFFKKGDQYISPFHDIPLFANAEGTVLNMVVEIPRWSNAKMEISKEASLNPIKQDIKKEKLRFVCNCFPHHGYIWNYGALPQCDCLDFKLGVSVSAPIDLKLAISRSMRARRLDASLNLIGGEGWKVAEELKTWENPSHTHPNTGAKGDNDPLDVCEIGFRVGRRGEIKQVKVLGTLAMIDEGETDWKIIVIDVTDPLADKLNDINDVETHMPGFLKATREWFEIYKMPTGKPPNVFAFDGQFKDKAFSTGIVQETHQQWKTLIEKKCDPGSISCMNTTVTGSPYAALPEEAKAVVDQSPPLGSPQPIPPEVDEWYYVSASGMKA